MRGVILLTFALMSGPSAAQLQTFSIEREVTAGSELATLFAQQVKIGGHPRIEAYISSLVEEIAAESNVQVPVEAELVDSKTPRIVSIMGGNIFVYRGLIPFAETESEFAAAVSHALAHVSARHFTRNLLKMQIVNVSIKPALTLSDGTTIPGGEVPLAFLAFERKSEVEADALAIQAMARAGFDPGAYLTMLEKFQRAGAADPAAELGPAWRWVVRPHEVTPERIEASRSIIAATRVSARFVPREASEFAAVRRLAIRSEAPPGL